MEAWREELYHHGIKGMKWGVRRTPEQRGHKTLKIPRKTRRAAKKDVKGYRKAQKLYGQRKVPKQIEAKYGPKSRGEDVGYEEVWSRYYTRMAFQEELKYYKQLERSQKKRAKAESSGREKVASYANVKISELMRDN